MFDLGPAICTISEGVPGHKQLNQRYMIKAIDQFEEEEKDNVVSLTLIVGLPFDYVYDIQGKYCN